MGETSLVNSKRAEFLARETAEYFASVLDKYLQEYILAVVSGDEKQLVLTSAAMWQASVSMTAFFKDLTMMGLAASGHKSDEEAACQQVANVLADAIRKKMLEIGSRSKSLESASDDTVPDTAPAPDRTLN